ncbi:MAG TPA: thioredoxin domain-containing protein, partial [Nitrospira sp.]|nr:thioredoxin domain-containing protein [Nitrospira sp.]
MKSRAMFGWTAAVWAVGVIGLVLAPVSAQAVKPELKGKFEILKDETSVHQPGKVKIIEFADFYCPHCHHFEETGVPLLMKEFGNRIEVTMVGFPVIPGKLPTPFDMYEQAKMMGKGDQMK